MKKSIAVFVVSLIVGASAYAQNAYVDVAYQTFDSSWNTDPAALRVTGGYVFHPNFAVEGMLGTSAKKGSDNTYGVNTKLKIDSMVGLYVRPMYAMSDSVEFYGRLGYTRLKLTASAPGYVSASDSDSDFSYGIGVAYSMNRSTRIFADYTKISDADTLAFGVGFKF